VNGIPSLGPRGEGWVALQLVSIAIVALGNRLGPSISIADAGAAQVIFVLGWLLYLISGVLFLSGVAVLRRARAFSVFPRPVAGQLVESGPYRFVRHPIYAGLIAGALGLALIRLSPATLLATVLLFVVLELKRRREETWLTSRFPGYAAYRTRTRALLPFIY
jgi:protein-S-isoprenylcysteine O-methyltransferase Ste14